MSGSVRKGGVRNRSAARLAAVQALYDAELAEASLESVLADFIEHDIGASEEAGDHFDIGMFTDILTGVFARRDDWDGIAREALSREWPPERLEPIVRAILRAGIFELAGQTDVPSKVVISEYVKVARAFYDGPEAGMVNAVLDRVARVVRAGEMGGGDAQP